jgi:hypothetical protein
MVDILCYKVNTSQVSVTNTTEEVEILKAILEPNTLSVGVHITFEFEGTHQSKASSGTLLIRLYVGDNSGPAIQMPSRPYAISQTPMIFRGKSNIRDFSSTNYVFVPTGFYDIYASSRFAYSQGGPSIILIDPSATIKVKMTAQWSIAHSSNSLLIENALIEAVKPGVMPI